MNIIRSRRQCRARTLTVGWQHAVAGASMLLVALAAFALLVNFAEPVVGRRSAFVATSARPQTPAIRLRTPTTVCRGHLNAMAVRLANCRRSLRASTAWVSGLRVAPA